MSRRLLLVLGIVAYFLAVLAYLGTDPRNARDTLPRYSSYNTSPEGLSLAFSYLRRRLGNEAVRTLQQRIEPGQLEPTAVVLRIAPGGWDWLSQLAEDAGGEQEQDEEDGKHDTQPQEPGDEPAKGDAKDEPAKENKAIAPPPPRPLLHPRERRWLEAGGRLVLAVDGPHGPLEVRSEDSSEGEDVEEGEVPSKVFPIWPAVRTLAPEAQRTLTGPALEGSYALVLLGDQPLISRLPVGRGEVILLACPETLRNDHLGEADHLALLEALAAGPGPVYFDERSHGLGYDPGLMALLRRWGLGPLLLALSLTAALAFWRHSRRIGAAEENYREQRSEAVELVDSLAQLYHRALRRGELVAMYHQHLVASTALATGLRGAALDERVSRLTGDLRVPPPERGDISAHQFKHALAALNQAFRRLEDGNGT